MKLTQKKLNDIFRSLPRSGKYHGAKFAYIAPKFAVLTVYRAPPDFPPDDKILTFVWDDYNQEWFLDI